MHQLLPLLHPVMFTTEAGGGRLASLPLPTPLFSKEKREGEEGGEGRTRFVARGETDPTYTERSQTSS